MAEDNGDHRGHGPNHPVGSSVRLTTDHVPGMQGATAVVESEVGPAA